MVPMLAMSTAVVKGLGGGNQLKEVVYKYIDTLEQVSPIELTVPPAGGQPPNRSLRLAKQNLRV